MRIEGRLTYRFSQGQSLGVPLAYAELWTKGEGDWVRLHAKWVGPNGDFTFDSPNSDHLQTKLFLSSRHQVGADADDPPFTGVRVRVPNFNASYIRQNQPRPVERWSVATYSEINGHASSVSPARDQQTPTIVASEWRLNPNITQRTPLLPVEQYQGGMWADACHIYRTIVLAIEKLLDLHLDPPAHLVLKPVDVYLQIFTDAERKVVFVTDGSVLQADDAQGNRRGSGLAASVTAADDTVFHPRIWIVPGFDSEDTILHEYGHHVYKCLWDYWSDPELRLYFPVGQHDGGKGPRDLVFGEAWANMFQCVVQDRERYTFTGLGFEVDLHHRPEPMDHKGPERDADRPVHEMCLTKFLVDVWQRHGLYYIWRTARLHKSKNFWEFRDHYRSVLGQHRDKLNEFDAILRENNLPVSGEAPW